MHRCLAKMMSKAVSITTASECNPIDIQETYKQ